MNFTDLPVFSYLVIPLLIAIARILDVSLGTIRIIFIAKGFKKVAPVIGFFEVLIWIFAISNVMKNLDNWVCYFAYAMGFATGNYIGMIIEEHLALGLEMIRVVTKSNADELVRSLRVEGYGTTQVKAMGAEGDVSVIYIVINRKMRNTVIKLVKDFNPQAFYTVEDIKYVNRELNQWLKLRK